MQALRFEQTGNLDYLKLVDVPVPIIKDDEVLIAVKAARLNRNDISNVMGRLPIQPSLARRVETMLG
jgi:NADPH:quinone reductase-like Zn-dependent oxidoreductase